MRGREGETGARRAGEESRPTGVALARQRAREEERAQRERHDAERHDQRVAAVARPGLARVGGLARRGIAPAPAARPAGDIRQDAEREHAGEEARALEERVVGAVEVEPDIAARQRPGEERREERPHARRAGETGALADV